MSVGLDLDVENGRDLSADASTIITTGRMSPEHLRVYRPHLTHGEMSVTYMRVRTTSERGPPA